VPTYQYRCTACGNDHEAVQAFSDSALTECPVCGGRLRKVFGSVGLVFKGSGFYKTDSRSGSSATAPAQRSKETAADGASKDSSSDTSKTPAASTTASTSSPSPSSSGSGGSGGGGAAAATAAA